MWCVLVRRPATDPGAPVATLRAVLLVAEACHELGVDVGDLLRTHARFARLVGEAVARHRRRNHVERILRAAAMCDGVGQRSDDLQELDDRSGPAVRDDDGQSIRLGRALVDEVNIQAVDFGLVVVECVQLSFLLAPVVFILPVGHELLQVGDVGSVLPTVANLIGKPRLSQSSIAYVQALRAPMSLGAAPHIVMPEAKESALNALRLDETVADAQAALAFVLHYYAWDWASAEREYRRALELNPGDADARSHCATILGQLGRADESVAEARTAVEADPISPMSRLVLVVSLTMARRFDATLAEARVAIELDPGIPLLHQSLAFALAGLGRYDEAVEARRQATILAPGEPHPQAHFGWACGLAGRGQEARTIFNDLERRRRLEYVGGYLLALASVGLGDHDRAISWLEQAVEDGDGLVTYLNTIFFFDPLRSEPRFRALLRRMGFPETATSPTAPGA